MKRPIVAVLLSALVLPGLGQIYLGRRIKGVALIMAINFLLLLVLFITLKVSSPVIAAHLSGTPLTPALIVEKMQPFAAWIKLLMAAFLGLWGYGLVDLLSAFREGADAPRD